ncbi:MAG: hypothetical protein LJF30_21975, partial [Acidobacteria bacterium]|nr:hypothetical protein [Acidobacteriota bacterium]
MSSRRFPSLLAPTAALAAAVLLSACSPPGSDPAATGAADAPATTGEPAAPHPGPPAAGPAVVHPDEAHFANLRQLTFGGQNAEGYWSPDGTRIIYQRMNEAEGLMCDQ